MATPEPNNEKQTYRHEFNDYSKEDQEPKTLTQDTLEETGPIPGEKGLDYEIIRELFTICNMYFPQVKVSF